MKILVVDDSPTTLELIAASLKKLGHDVLPAKSGQEGIEIFRSEHPDLIILDVMMEGMNGFECAKKIRELTTNDWIPIIFLSASIDDESISQGINAGGDDYLTKPFSEITLAAKIKAMQRIAEMRKQLFDTTKELEILSSTDPLTGLYNRFQFERSLREKLAECDRHNLKLSLLFIDLDNFKTINDSLGHRMGDLLLKEVANRLRECLRVEDFIARIGGDEFIIILTHLDNFSEAGETAQKIIYSLSDIVSLEHYNTRISASIGIACYPDANTTHQGLVQNADIAMYHAKGLGRNNFQYYTEDLNQKYRQRINLEHDLKFALERGEMFITYQPICNLLTKKMESLEALLRWRHPECGMISPNIFIPIAEETGLINQIGSWVIEKVCEKRAKWYMQGYDNFKLSVNVSLHQIFQEDFYEFVSHIIEKTQLPPRLLDIELTESTVMTYTSHLKSTINRLHELGIGISIDDFGTRYSTLTSLKTLPITTLKIDKAFLKNIITDPKNSIIVRSLIALANNLNLNVIAEGVQTDEQLQFLVVNGCLLGQGYLLSKPLNEKKISLYLEQQTSARLFSTSQDK